MNKNIILVEDDEIYAKILKIGLEESGYAVHIFQDGDEAVDAITRIKPIAILLDIILPKLSGIAACRKIKENPESKSIPVIMITANAEEGMVKSALVAGADGYITKHNDIKTIYTEIDEKIKKTIRSYRNRN